MSAQEVNTWRSKSEVTTVGTAVPNPILKFEQAPFHANTITLLKQNFSSPSVIQSQSWPLALSGRDMVASAATGSGKTLGFLLPAFEHIKNNTPANSGYRRGGPLALILAPTRELAQQIQAECNKFSSSYGIRNACLFGGQGNRYEQTAQLSRDPQILIATPGRLSDFLASRKTSLSNISYLVLDEADRMLEMGFEEHIREIVNQISTDRQTLMWSATWPKSVESLAKDYFKDYIRVNIGSMELSANPNIKQNVLYCSTNEKLKMLQDHLLSHPNSKTLVFCQTKRNCEEVGLQIGQLTRGTIPMATLHGDKTQQQRNNILEDFRANILKVVFATDVAARGLDVSDIETVINYDFPSNIETYVHRIGRTARAGKKGQAISYFTDQDASQAKDLAEVLKKAGQPVPEAIANLMTQKNRSGSNNSRSQNNNRSGSSNPYGGKPLFNANNSTNYSNYGNNRNSSNYGNNRNSSNSNYRGRDNRTSHNIFDDFPDLKSDFNPFR
uniref:RNA helicase n=1 Tax=Arcella intermedia TaxID=1963864 RepID=A0A6B2L1D1_9EUKA